MEQRHRKAIKKNLVNLSKDLDFEVLEPYLLEGDIFPDGKLDAFKAIHEKPKQTVAFLNDIQRRGPRAFGVLVQALLATNQGHCADWLDPDGEIPRPAPTTSVQAPARSRESARQPVIGVQESMGSNLSSPRDEVDDRGVQDTNTIAYPWDNDNSYPMKKYPRGIVLIINNEVFLDDQTLPQRIGTQKDCETIENLFREELGFIILKKNNLNLVQMKELFKLQQQGDHSNYDCFVSVILSHGLKEGICGTDYDKNKGDVLVVEDIVEVMDQCQSLQGKPKVFFTQACRGEKVHKPTQFDARRPQEDIERDMQKLQIKEVEPVATQTVTPRTHVGSDVLVAFPTIKGYAAAREEDTGTWYISNLCKVLRENAHREDVCSMLTMVNNEVGEQRGSLSDGHTVTQTSEFKATLKKKLYFPPVSKPQGVQPSSP